MHHFTPCSRSPAEVKIFDVFGSIFSLYAVDDFFFFSFLSVTGLILALMVNVCGNFIFFG